MGQKKMFVCKLCLSEEIKSNSFRLDECGCKFCSNCLKQYVRLNIEEGNIAQLTCPDAACKITGHLSRRDIELLTTPALMRRYIRLSFERDVDLDPYRTFCPRVGCETVCRLTRHESDSSLFSLSKDRPLSPHPVVCRMCAFTFCSVCKEPWHGVGVSCDDAARGKDSGLCVPYGPVATHANIKRCPVCHIPIERNMGCAQMMCKRCRHVFCWYCLTSLDDDFFLRHYDSGPCKNMLGHSRGSIILHRAQVVGIFAGFSILLIVASPFILLAAPCIMCVKCDCHGAARTRHHSGRRPPRSCLSPTPSSTDIENASRGPTFALADDSIFEPPATSPALGDTAAVAAGATGAAADPSTDASTSPALRRASSPTIALPASSRPSSAFAAMRSRLTGARPGSPAPVKHVN